MVISILMNKSDLNGKHLLAIDYGTKYTGIATHKVGVDPIILLQERMKYENDTQLINDIKNFIEDEFIDLVIVGVPYFTDGTESKMTQAIKKFITELTKSLDINVVEQDETLSTFEAEERMKNDPRFNFQVDYSKIDSMSALITLEEFLNSKDN